MNPNNLSCLILRPVELKKDFFLSSRPPNMSILDLILLVGAVLVVLAVLIGFCCYCLQFTGTGDLPHLKEKDQLYTAIQVFSSFTLQLLQSPIVMLRLVCLTHPLTFHHHLRGDDCLKLQKLNTSTPIVDPMKTPSESHWKEMPTIPKKLVKSTQFLR